ncbi:TRAP transporter small permease [Chelativorans sp. M5D2P16]|uniref:TRAP transporter small permease n=1 Tax=Chelativorans sp. M5D2P16 TaxID=3095678 RepID=UPI002ACAF36C|nr:TRAP transporter small permease [Chelativorans sp. M5D2P16]MDZ5696003.1 TRAP transporter small permease [Chelativorans sp. M5D2P16]
MYQRIEFVFAVVLLGLIVVLVGVAAAARVAGAPIIWSIEVAQLLFAWLAMIAADLALQQERHIGMSLLLDALPPPIRRYAELANLGILLALVGFLLVYALKNTVLMHPRLIGATQMNASLVHASMAAGLLLMLRTLVLRIYRGIRTPGG